MHKKWEQVLCQGLEAATENPTLPRDGATVRNSPTCLIFCDQKIIWLWIRSFWIGSVSDWVFRLGQISYLSKMRDLQHVTLSSWSVPPCSSNLLTAEALCDEWVPVSINLSNPSVHYIKISTRGHVIYTATKTELWPFKKCQFFWRFYLCHHVCIHITIVI